MISSILNATGIGSSSTNDCSSSNLNMPNQETHASSSAPIAFENGSVYLDLHDLLTTGFYLNNLEDFTREGLVKLYTDLINYNKHYKSNKQNPTSAQNIRDHFCFILDGRWPSTSRFFNAGTELIKDPGQIIMVDKRQGGCKEESTYIKKDYNSNDTINKNDTNAPGTDQEQKNIIDKYKKKMSKKSSEKEPLTQISEENDSDPESISESVEGEAEEDDPNEDHFDKFLTAFNDFKKKSTANVKRNRTLAKEAKSQAVQASNDADAAMGIALAAKEEAEKANKNITNALKITLPENYSDFKISQKFKLYQIAKNKYRAVVFNNRRRGIFRIDVIDKNTFLVTQENNDNNIVSNIPAIETELVNVRLEQKSAVKKKNGKCAVYCQILARSDKREEIAKRILEEKYDSSRKNKFGINLAPPEEYDIDETLGYMIRHLKEEDTGLPTLHSFDYSREGFYIIYLNDVDNEKKQRRMLLHPDREVKHRECCTKWYPACPLQILKLDEAKMTLANFQKLADWKNYFLWENEILPTPEAFKRRQQENEQRRIERQQIAEAGEQEGETLDEW